jgi:hypothetical protein
MTKGPWLHQKSSKKSSHWKFDVALFILKSLRTSQRGQAMYNVEVSYNEWLDTTTYMCF